MPGLREYVLDQFRLPHGPLGPLAGRVMATRSANRERSRWTVGLLDLAPGERVLEVGYGPGLGIRAALAAVPDGHVTGLDHSPLMHRAATRRLGDVVQTGRVRLLCGDAQDPPPGLGPFDAIFSCNVWLFWSEPVDTLRGLAGLLAPHGRIAVTHQPRAAAPNSMSAAAVCVIGTTPGALS